MSSDQAPAAEPTAAAPAIAIVDSYPQAQPLIDAGVRAFARVSLAVLEGQAAAPTAELRALEKVLTLATAQYDALAASAPGEVETQSAQHAAQLAALRPHLETLDALDGVVSGLEEAARTLDQQTRQLEASIGDVLS